MFDSWPNSGGMKQFVVIFPGIAQDSLRLHFVKNVRDFGIEDVQYLKLLFSRVPDRSSRRSLSVGASTDC